MKPVSIAHRPPTSPLPDDAPPSGRLSGWQRVKQFLVRHLVDRPELQVWYTCDDSGNLWWSAYDPKADRAVNHLSESDMRRWLEQSRR